VISRVSDVQSFAELGANIGRLQVRLEDLNTQVATGRRLERPSDDPAGAGIVVRSFSTLDGLDRDRRSAGFARRFLVAQDALLDDARGVIDRAREIAVQHASGLLTPSEHAAAAEEVHELLEAMVAIGNSDLAGRYLFSAGEDATGQVPFVHPDDPAFDAANPYVGAARALEVAIDGGEVVRVTTPGGQALGPAIAALADLESRLMGGTDSAQSLPLLDDAAAALATERASLGARLGRVGERERQIQHGELVVTQALADTRDADMVEVVTHLTQVQGQLQVALAASQRILDAALTNLLGF
jgi:flagellar hook-associated protein 3 FlgL